MWGKGLDLPSRFRLQLGKWQLALIVFAAIYAFLLIANLGSISLQWDELNHFNGAILLLRGQIWDYIGFNSFYPPLFNLFTTLYFAIGGASVITGRLVSVTFTLLSLFVVYKIGKEMYSEKAGFFAAAFFAVMPGIVVLSSVAMIETMLIFVCSLSLLFFFRWLQRNRNQDLIISVAALVLGVAVKYQIIVVVPIIMVVSVLVLGRKLDLKKHVSSFVHSKYLYVGIACGCLAAVLLYAFYTSGLMGVWLYAIQVGNEGQVSYSNRFAAPIFYLIEMVWPYSNQHPISLLLYGLGIAGLAFFVYRRKPSDKFLLVWFLTAFVIFTLIPNRQWRYVTPLFPVLAISAAELVTSGYSAAKQKWKSAKNSKNRKLLSKFAAAFLIVFTFVGVFYSSTDAYTWAVNDQTHIPIEPAANYIANHPADNRSVIVLCATNLFSKDMVWFYLNSASPSQMSVYSYPKDAVDAFTPQFNVDNFVSYCQTNRTAYVMLYEYGWTSKYFDSNLTPQAVYSMLNDTGRFTLQATFGTPPNRVFVFSFK